MMNYKQIWAKARPYVISFVVLIIFIELIWGLTAGALIGASLGTDKDTQEEIGRLLKEKGIERPSPSTMSDDWYEKLPPDVKEDMSIIVKRKLRVINWFVVTISVSALVFAIAGFLWGYLDRAFISVGILVILSLLVNNPVVQFPHAKLLSVMQKTLIVIVQFGFTYLFGYLGALIGRKRMKVNS